MRTKVRRVLVALSFLPLLSCESTLGPDPSPVVTYTLITESRNGCWKDYTKWEQDELGWFISEQTSIQLPSPCSEIERWTWNER